MTRSHLRGLSKLRVLGDEEESAKEKNGPKEKWGGCDVLRTKTVSNAFPRSSRMRREKCPQAEQHREQDLQGYSNIGGVVRAKCKN